MLKLVNNNSYWWHGLTHFEPDKPTDLTNDAQPSQPATPDKGGTTFPTCHKGRTAFPTSHPDHTNILTNQQPDQSTT